jgi:DNA-binding MarR family transcriptional regulator
MGHATIPTDRRPIGYWLKLIDRLIEEQLDALLAEVRLTRRHWQVLNVLHRGPSTFEAIDIQVAPFLDAAEPTTRPILEDLRQRGWATVTGEGHAVLTTAGAAAHGDLLDKVSDSRRTIVAGIAAEEYQATVDVLRRMAVNLGWAEPTA